jgi:AcrR family transcriptional regulator
MSSEKRKYELRARAERQAETRQRIAAATAELHEEVGPAQTTVAEIARRAGVQRLTVYNNFPDDYQLFAACNQHFFVQHPPPDLSSAEGDDPLERLEHLLRRLYGWYRRTERMSTNVQRDRELVPALDALLRDTSDAQLAYLADSLAATLAERGARRRPVRAAVALALDFWTWRRLAKEGLADRAAAELMSGAVRTAASGKGSPR